MVDWIRHSVAVPWKLRGPIPPFNHGVSCRGLPRDQASFLKQEISRLTLNGVFRFLESSSWVSRDFLVPKPAGARWRMIIDLREINNHCK